MMAESGVRTKEKVIPIYWMDWDNPCENNLILVYTDCVFYDNFGPIKTGTHYDKIILDCNRCKVELQNIVKRNDGGGTVSSTFLDLKVFVANTPFQLSRRDYQECIDDDLGEIREPLPSEMLPTEPIDSSKYSGIRRLWFEVGGILDIKRLVGDIKFNHWVILYGPTGSKDQAKECYIHWFVDAIKQCKELGIPCYVRNLGSKTIHEFSKGVVASYGFLPSGEDFKNWPKVVQVRERPVGFQPSSGLLDANPDHQYTFGDSDVQDIAKIV